jgi:hypothetical protein
MRVYKAAHSGSMPAAFIPQYSSLTNLGSKQTFVPISAASSPDGFQIPSNLQAKACRVAAVFLSLLLKAIYNAVGRKASGTVAAIHRPREGNFFTCA